jgi:hypothetical protein
LTLASLDRRLCDLGQKGNSCPKGISEVQEPHLGGKDPDHCHRRAPISSCKSIFQLASLGLVPGCACIEEWKGDAVVRGAFGEGAEVGWTQGSRSFAGFASEVILPG